MIANLFPLQKDGSFHVRAKKVKIHDEESETAEHEEKYDEAEEDADGVPDGEEHSGRTRWWQKADNPVPSLWTRLNNPSICLSSNVLLFRIKIPVSSAFQKLPQR